MKQKWILAVLAVAAMACNSNSKTKETTPAATPAVTAKDSMAAKPAVYTMDMVVNDKDLSCNMSLKEGIGDTAHYHGKVYGFCSIACKREFQSRPAYYVKE